jgi:hypothetical protein
LEKKSLTRLAKKDANLHQSVVLRRTKDQAGAVFPTAIAGSHVVKEVVEVANGNPGQVKRVEEEFVDVFQAAELLTCLRMS